MSKTKQKKVENLSILGIIELQPEEDGEKLIQRAVDDGYAIYLAMAHKKLQIVSTKLDKIENILSKNATELSRVKATIRSKK